MCVLNAGAHTIGFAQCFTFKQRLFNFSDTGKPDPSIPAPFLQALQSLCPDNNDSNTNLAPLDPFSTKIFDNMYYVNLVRNFGLLQTDQDLMHYQTTASLVIKYSECPLQFHQDFATSLEKMGHIGILTGQQGQIRKNCRVVN